MRKEKIPTKYTGIGISRLLKYTEYEKCIVIEIRGGYIKKEKILIANPPLLAHFDPKKDIAIQSDASKDEPWFCLMKDKIPVAYASRVYQKQRIVKTCSPGYPRSNGLAEKAVHISKQLLKKCHSEKVDLETALLEYRCTPIVELNASPSELLMSRLLKIKLPISKDKSKPTLQRNNHANLIKAQGKYKEWHDKRNNKKEVIFYEGHKVVLLKKDKWIPGKIISKIVSPRSYWVELLELNESEEEGNVESKNIEGSEPQKKIVAWTDHKPLVSISNKNVSEIPSIRLQTMRIKLFEYDIELKYLPGNNMHTVDLVSRNCIKSSEDTSELDTLDIVHIVNRYNPHNSIYDLQKETRQDNVLMKTCSPGYPRSNGLAEKAVHISKQLLKKCHSEKVDLETALLEYRCTPIVELNASPSELLMSRLLKIKLPISKDKSKPTLQRNNHANLIKAQGKYKEWHDKRNNKKEVIFYEGHKVVLLKKDKWIPGKIISKIVSPRSYWVELLELNESEEEGNVESKNIEGSEPQKKIVAWTDHKPLVSISNKNVSEIPSIRLQTMRIKLFEYDIELKYLPGNNMHTVDLVSRNCIKSSEDTSELDTLDIVHIVNRYNPHNSIYDLQKETRQDNVLMKTCSPGYPRSNGLAEKAVHISKQLLKKCHSEKVDLETALLEYRCTPIVELNASPSELLMSRLLKIKLPISKDKSKPTLQRNNHANLIKAQGKYKEWHDKRNNKKEVIFYEGHKVVLLKKDKWIPGKIISKIVSPRSYWVELLELNESEEEGNVESKNIEGSEPQKKIVAWTDHKPLVSISNKNVSEIPSIRLQTMRIKLFEYDIELKYLPGNNMHTVDLVSRNCIKSSEDTSELDTLDIVHIVNRYNPHNSIYDLQKETRQDNVLMKTCSPGYPRSNGLAEKAVHISKQLLKKCHSEKVDLETALLEYRCTPIVELNASPSELLMSRLLKIKLPISKDKSKPTLQRNNHANLIKAQGKYKEWHDKRNNKKEVIFYEGHKVVLLKKDKWIPGKIISKIVSPRSYWVELLELNESEEEGNVESKNIEGSEPQKKIVAWTDHKPLVSISNKNVSEIPSIRLQTMRIKLFEYDIELKYLPGNNMHTVDLVSRNCIKSSEDTSELDTLDIVHIVNRYNPHNSIYDLQKETRQDNVLMKTCSPGYPRSNGLAEKAVHISKQLLKKCHSEKVDLETALLEYRCTPIVELNASPSELLMSRLLKIKLPISKDKSKPTLQRNNHANLIKAQGKYKEWHDKRNNKKEVIFYEGHKVVLLKKDKWIPGKIISKIVSPRSYWVELLELNESEEEGNVESKNIEGSEPQKKIVAWTDHKPLVSISNKNVSEIPSIRLQTMRIKLFEYDIELKYLPGNNMHTVDLVSRNCIKSSEDTSELDTLDIVHIVNRYNPHNSIYDLQKETRQDNVLMKTCSPGYPRSNGLAEKAVHISKQLLKKCHSEKVDLETALLEYRCTPIVELNASPSELLMSRLLKIKLPISKDKSKPTLQRNNHANLIKAQGKYKEWHDKRNNKKEVIFYEGHKVVLLKKDKWIPGKIISKIVSPRSYWVELLELNESEEEGNVESKNIEGSEPQKKIVAWTDHKPLVSISNKNVSEIPSIRLQTMRIKLFEYDIELKYLPGNNMHTVDLVSRNCIKSSEDTSELDTLDIVHIVNRYNPHNSIYDLQKETRQDNVLMKTCSPGYPRSNGLAEKAVHISKQLLKKCHSEKVDLETALLEYRCTPIVELNASPSELLMSRLLKIKLPISKDKSKPTLQRNNHANLIKAQGKYKEWHDKRNNKKEVIFYEGHKVVLLKKDKWIPGKIISKIVSPRSYWVELLELNESEEEGNVESKNIEGSEPQK
ncbi:hypothetical protein QTP88_028220 [Uroleucon formosanum]